MYLGALRFEEIYFAKPWGGRALHRVARKRLPAGERMGESWEVADHPHGTSVVQEGPLAGWTLRALMQEHGKPLLGRQANGRFPLIVKLLDVSGAFSVQVHPDDACARAMHLKDGGKTEGWYILRGGERAWVMAGLKSARDVAQLSALAASGDLAARLRKFRARSGDAWLCEAGAIHAFGGGVVLFEVQQNSDATFRLYDWGRVGEDGKPRCLHVEEAVRAVNGRAVSPLRPKRMKLPGLPFRAQRVIGCGHFVMDRWRVHRACGRAKENRFEMLHVLSGAGRLRDPRWQDVPLTMGRTVLVPACVNEYEIVPRGRLEIVRVAEPE